MDLDRVLIEAKEILDLRNSYINDNKSLDDFNNEIDIKYIKLKKEKEKIFELCKSGSMDLERLTYMINMAKQVQNNSITEYDASVKVGTRLVDEFVKPQLKK
jgi:hypothetical protein